MAGLRQPQGYMAYYSVELDQNWSALGHINTNIGANFT